MSEQPRGGVPITDHAALNRIPCGVGIYDVTADQVEMKYLNDGYYQMIGARREQRGQFSGDSVIAAIHPEDRPLILEEAHASVRENRMFQICFRVLGGSGAYLWIGIRANHAPLDDRTERFFAAYYNVDDYVSRQTVLEAQSKDLRTILDNVPGGVAIFSHCDRKIQLEYANNGYYALHHGSREYWQGKSRNPVDWLLPEDRALFWKAFDLVNTGRQELGSAAYRIVGEDGGCHWINNQFRFAYVRDGISYFYASFTDLDDLKAAEQARAETRKMYEAAVEDSNLVVWEYDLKNHRITMAENEFTKYDYRKFGLPKVTENAPQSLLPYIDDTYTGVFLELYEKVEAGAPHASCEVWYKLVPGTEPRCEHISYTTVFDAGGKPVKAYGIGQNITRQKLAQAEYDRLRAQLTGNLTDIISSTQLNLSKNLYLNGYSPLAGVVKSLERQTADEHFTAAAAAIDSAPLKEGVLRDFNCANLLALFQSGKKQVERTYPVKTSQGGTLWVHTTLQMMQNPVTEDVEAITYSRDITEQKRTGEIVSRLSSTGCDYIGVLDVLENSFSMHTCNWGCTEISAGQKHDYDVIRERLSERYLVPDKRQRFLQASSTEALTASLREKAQYVVAYDYPDPFISDAPLKKQIIFSWLNDEKREILCIQQDVTEAYRREQEQILALEKAKNEADAANDAKSAFLSGMSHDLRTPLNGVLGFTAFALKERDPQKKQEYLEKIDTSGKLLRDLINDTLELSRIESGKAKLEIEGVMPYDLIPAVTTALKPSAELKRLQYETEFAIDVETPIWCDKLKVQKIALNLISNAIKYTPEGGKVSVGLRLDPASGGDGVYLLTVADTGIGMSESFIQRMYEPFAQEKRSESIKELGTGLGLSIVKRYVDLMGGTIEVASRLHQGTRIQVRLPVSTENRTLTHAKPGEPAAQSLSGKRILLCEDNFMNTEIAVMLLKDRGMLVETAENGKDALAKFQAAEPEHFDAILMDIRMPIMDGYDAARLIRALPRPDAVRIPIIAMTADAFEESVRTAEESGMNAYVTKPIDPAAFFQTLAQFITPPPQASE